ncbi:biotin transporter BioY [Nocardioides sp. CER19]|uniref:biotin transporter BioY n=1 Tax=Nocardioides sp. CER19 TaxID=3038538 RepID=UPI00244AC924|nr:biotin transporter BioY [Nocardioides sp. CER19]MDH2414134.1 biotin transporter BioY [Nocardioides sp. CER19]
MTTTDTTTTAVDVRRRFTTTDLALIAVFAALIAVAAYTAGIPVGGAGVPITLQTFALILTGLVLGPVRGFLAASLYLLLGLVGLPVFAEHTSGAAVFTGPTAGYLYSFPVLTAVAGLGAVLVGVKRTRALFLFVPAVAAVLVNHAAGITGLRLALDVSWAKAASFDAPFWVGDLIKAAVAAIVAAEVHRAFPRLLGSRG